MDKMTQTDVRSRAPLRSNLKMRSRIMFYSLQSLLVSNYLRNFNFLLMKNTVSKSVSVLLIVVSLFLCLFVATRLNDFRNMFTWRPIQMNTFFS